MRPDQIAPYAPAVIWLLQGALSSDDGGPWNLLLAHETPVREYLAKIGLELVLSEPDGYAFLRQPEWEGESGQRGALPRLTRRDRLSYHVTLLCALLRERLDQFEPSTPETDRLILTGDDLRDMLRPFLRERGAEAAGAHIPLCGGGRGVQQIGRGQRPLCDEPVQAAQQLLVVTPLDKTHVVEPYISACHFVSNVSNTVDENDSRVVNLTIREYYDQKAAFGQLARAEA